MNAGLLGKSLYRLLHVEPGVQRAAARAGGRQPGVGPACVAFPADEVIANAEQPGALARLVATRVAALPGVEAVGYADWCRWVGLAPSSGFQSSGAPRRCDGESSRPADQRGILHGAAGHARARPRFSGRRGRVGASRHDHQ